MLHLLKQKQINQIKVDSAGTANYHIGEAPDKRTIINAKQHGVDLSPLRARVFTQHDFNEFDLILTMDKSNTQNVLRLLPHPSYQQKVSLFLDFAINNSGKEVPDPYYGNENDFESVFQLVYSACESLIDKLASIEWN